jgi:hypothetical protein
VVEAAGVEGSGIDARIREDHVAPSTNEVAIDTVADPRDQARSHAVSQAVLAGDSESGDPLLELCHCRLELRGGNAVVDRDVVLLIWPPEDFGHDLDDN